MGDPLHDGVSDAALSGAGDGDLSRLDVLFRRMNADERAVLLIVAEQLSGKGRREYGPLRLDGDRRDFAAEALAEAADGLAYVAVALRQVALRRNGGV